MTRKPIAYVQDSWHTDITDHCRTAFMAELARHGYATGDVELFSVPGSLEIPLMARKLAAPAATRRSARAGRRGRRHLPPRVRGAGGAAGHRADLAERSARAVRRAQPHHFHEHAVHGSSSRSTCSPRARSSRRRAGVIGQLAAVASAHRAGRTPHQTLDGPRPRGQLMRSPWAGARASGRPDLLPRVAAHGGQVGRRRSPARRGTGPVVVEVPEDGGDVDGADVHESEPGTVEQRASGSGGQIGKRAASSGSRRPGPPRSPRPRTAACISIPPA